MYYSILQFQEREYFLDVIVLPLTLMTSFYISNQIAAISEEISKKQSYLSRQNIAALGPDASRILMT